MTTVTNEQIDSLLHALDHEPVAQDYAVVRRWLEMVAAEPAMANPQILEALKVSMRALDDWLRTYAPEMCDEAKVKESRERIAQTGTLAYIALVQQGNRKALESSAEPTPSNCPKCAVSLTTADVAAGKCYSCGAELRTSPSQEKKMADQTKWDTAQVLANGVLDRPAPKDSCPVDAKLTSIDAEDGSVETLRKALESGGITAAMYYGCWKIWKTESGFSGQLMQYHNVTGSFGDKSLDDATAQAREWWATTYG